MPDMDKDATIMHPVEHAPRALLDGELLEQFRSALESAAIQVAVRMAAEYADERIYAFALYTDEDYKRVSITMSTEAGLQSAAAARWARPRFRRIWPNAEALATSLRWSHWELPQHKLLGKSQEFKTPQRLLNKLWKSANVRTSNDYMEVEDAVTVALAQAVEAVQEQGILHGRVVFNVFAERDGAERCLRHSQLLNPPDTHQWYASTLSAACEARKRDYAGMLADFRTVLEEVTVQAARLAVDRYAQEDIYSFALYTSGGFEYVFPTLATETGLNAAAERYRQSRIAKNAADLDFRTMLRWSPCDSPHHQSLGDIEGVERAGKLLRKFWKSVDNESDEAFVDAEKAVHDAMIQALAAVRDRGIFQGRVAFNVLKGDQSDEERLEFSERLNADVIHAWVCRTRKEGHRVYDALLDRLDHSTHD